jgi:hypothetical protein
VASLKVMTWSLPGGTGENRENLSKVSRCLDRDLNSLSPEYETVLLLCCLGLAVTLTVAVSCKQTTFISGQLLR